MSDDRDRANLRSSVTVREVFDSDDRDRANLRSSVTTVREVFDLYEGTEGHRKAVRTQESRHRHLDDFAAGHGHRPVSELRPADLVLWANSHKGWVSDWTIKGAMANVQRPLNWAARMGLVDRNPMAGISNPPGEPARPLEPKEFQALLRNSVPEFRRFLVFLRFTGARPCEAEALEWSFLDLARNCAVLRVHKTSRTRKDKKPRIIVLHPVVVKLLKWLQRRLVLPALPEGQAMFTPRELRLALGGRLPFHLATKLRSLNLEATGNCLARLYPRRTVEALQGEVEKGESRRFVFVNCLGKPWTRNAVCLQLAKVRKRAGLPMAAKLYGLRHAFGTFCCTKGVELKTLAELMGHSTTRMTEHYLHLAGQVDHLHESLLRAFNGK